LQDHGEETFFIQNLLNLHKISTSTFLHSFPFLQEDFDIVWKRIVEMTHDESAIVRDQALHNLGDGSPRHLQEVVMEAAERLYNDPDLKVRKKARKMCISYRTTGKWNVL